MGSLAGNLQAAVRQAERMVELTTRPELLSRRREEVSLWSVAEQLEHLSRAGRLTLDEIDRLLDDPGAGARVRWTWIGRIVLTVGWIPRGRGRAPRSTRPGGVAPGDLGPGVEELRQRLSGLAGRLDAVAACRTGFRHPYFGCLPPAAWIRFLAVHQRHHLRIVEEILQGATDARRPG